MTGKGAVDSTGLSAYLLSPHSADGLGRQENGGIVTVRQEVERERRRVLLMFIALILFLLLS
jgi:hypothetical protein